MALKKVNNEEVQKPYVLQNLCQTDRIWYNKDTHSFSGDMSFTFEDKPETSTLDLNYARNVAINAILYDKADEDLPEEDEPVYLLIEMTQDEDNVLEMITAVPATDKEFMAAVQGDYPDVKIFHVPPYQKMIDVEDDHSMDSYNQKKDAILAGLTVIMHEVDLKRSEEVLSFPAISINGFEVSGISTHIGIDGFRYYKLQSEKQAFPGMQEYRLEEFFSRLRVDEQDGVLEGVRKAVIAIRGEKKEKSHQVKM